MDKKTARALNELESGRVLESCGIRMVHSMLLTDGRRELLEQAARELGFPVVMKVLSDDILHKTDAGCVVLDVGSVEAMESAYGAILQNAARYAPGARVQGVLVQQMLPKGLEILLGVSTDPQFGHVVMIGLGGILVELLQAVSLRVLPISRRDAEEMIDETPLKKACEDLRGVRYDREELVQALLSLSSLIEKNPNITEIDVNPLMLYGDGRPATGVDAVVVRSA